MTVPAIVAPELHDYFPWENQLICRWAGFAEFRAAEKIAYTLSVLDPILNYFSGTEHWIGFKFATQLNFDLLNKMFDLIFDELE